MFAHFRLPLFEAVEITAPCKKATNVRPIVSIVIGTTVADAERELIMASLSYYGGNKKMTAKRLEISLKTLYTKLHQYGVMV